jgi:hypothetical protein
MTTRRSATALLALLLAATAAPAQARKRPDEGRRLERLLRYERLGWHSPSWKWWQQCDTVIYVMAGPDGIIAGTIQEGEKMCPDEERGALRRRPA